MDQVDEITQSNADPAQKQEAYLEILHSIEPVAGNEAQLAQFVDKVAKIAFARNVTQPVIDQFIDYVTQSKDTEFQTTVLKSTLDSLLPLLVSYEPQEMKARAKLADVLQAEEEYPQAARILQEGLNGERSELTEDIKFETYVRIVRCYLETDQPERAEPPLSRAQHTRPYVSKLDPETDLHFKMSQARIFDSNRKFLEASNKYHIISQEAAVDEEDRLQCLSQAIICSILSPAGPLRGQALRRLYNDDRSKQLAQYGILEKVYLDRLLSPEDVSGLEKQLQPHQMAVTADGTTVLAKAVIEHNVMAVSKIYNNIGLQELGRFLGLEQERAEEYTAKMIMQNRLAAKIDQVDGYIYFKSQLDTDMESQGNDFDYAKGDVNGNGIVLLKQLDSNIYDICAGLEEIATRVQHTVDPA